MKKNFFMCLAVLMLFFASSASLFSAEDEPMPENTNKSIYGIDFADGSAYHFKLSTLEGVSLQRYVAGPYKVIEVVLEIAGSSSQVRIYSTEALTALDMQEMGQSALPTNLQKYSNAPTQVANLNAKTQEKTANQQSLPLIKEYPVTTHAKTIEFKVSKNEIIKFHRAILREFINSNGETASNNFTFSE